jgi:hypothetical protein
MRSKMIAAALAAATLLTLSACKQESATSSIDGTWKADLASVKIESEPNQLLLQDGTFSCPTCTPAYSVAADGAFHPVERPYADSMSVAVDDDHTVTVTAKKGDTVVGTTRYAVSADGKTLTIDYSDSSVPNAKPVTGNLTQNRTAAGPAGSHAVSGSWQVAQYNTVSDEGLVMTFKVDGDQVQMSAPSGIGYEATIGGPDVPIAGDTAGTTASIAKTGDNTYVETDKRDGEVILVITMTVGDDGKLHVVQEDKRNGSKMTYDATKS